MSYSILARCARTGQLGLGVASYSIAVGRYSDAAVRPEFGATFTQGNPLPRNNRFALNLLVQGWNGRARGKSGVVMIWVGNLGMAVVDIVR